MNLCRRKALCRLVAPLIALLPLPARAWEGVPLLPPTIAQKAQTYYEQPLFVSGFGSWRSRILQFPLPKAAAAPALTDPFGGGTSIILHLENFGEHDWCYPVPGARVTSPYGWRNGRGHTGTDIKTFGEDRICAAFEGVVTLSENYGGYGNCIVVSHSYGLTTLYSHNLRNMVRVGDHVTAGQVIALIGRTGHATGDHLHFECRVMGIAFNSQFIFNHDTNQLQHHPVMLTNDGIARVLPLHLYLLLVVFLCILVVVSKKSSNFAHCMTYMICPITLSLCFLVLVAWI